MKITTRYHGPTETRGSRIVATAAAGPRRRFTMAYDYSLDPAGNHDAAAWMLAGLNGLENHLMLSGETGRIGTRAHHFAAADTTSAA
jgi:hypothetical protein